MFKTHKYTIKEKDKRLYFSVSKQSKYNVGIMEFTQMISINPLSLI